MSNWEMCSKNAFMPALEIQSSEYSSGSIFDAAIAADNVIRKQNDILKTCLFLLHLALYLLPNRKNIFIKSEYHSQYDISKCLF